MVNCPCALLRTADTACTTVLFEFNRLVSTARTVTPGMGTLLLSRTTPEMVVYDRGGSAKTTVEELRKLGVKKVGIVPKGKTKWSVAEADQPEVMSQRGQTEGSIGTLKRYGFSGRRERSNQTVEAAGQRAMVSLNLNKLMRDVVKREKQAQMTTA